MQGGLLDGLLAVGFFLVGALGQSEGRHDAVEGIGVLVDETEQFAHHFLSVVGGIAEFLPPLVPSRLVARQVGDHRSQGGTQGTHVGRDGASARSRRLAGSLLGESLHGEVGELWLLFGILHEVFDDLFTWVEGPEVVESHGMYGDLDDVVLGDSGGALLFFQEIASRLDECPLGHESHDFRPSDADAPLVGTPAHLVEGFVQWRDIDVGDVHRHLRDAVFVDVPTDGLGLFQRARQHDGVPVGILHGLPRDGVALATWTAFLPHVEGDGVGPPGGRGVEVEVDGDEEVASAHHGASCPGDALVHGAASEVGLLARRGQFFGNAFVFAGAADGQVAPLLGACRRFIAIAGDEQFVGDALGQLPGQLGALLQCDAADGDERQDVGSADARVCPVVLAHVDELSGLPHGLEGCFHDGSRFAHEGDDGAVGGLSGVDVEESDAFGVFYLGGDLPDGFRVAPFAEIGHAFHDLSFHVG